METLSTDRIKIFRQWTQNWERESEYHSNNDVANGKSDHNVEAAALEENEDERTREEETWNEI